MIEAGGSEGNVCEGTEVTKKTGQVPAELLSGKIKITEGPTSAKETEKARLQMLIDLFDKKIRIGGFGKNCAR